MENDARAHPRYEVDAAVDVGPPDATSLGAGSHTIQNLSLGGICIQTARIPEVGAIVDVVLRFGRSSTETLALRGQVVWVNREPPQDVGIRWLELDEAARVELVSYLERVRTRST
jgi:hypothetical protein